MRTALYQVDTQKMVDVTEILARHHGLDPESLEAGVIDVIKVTDFCTAGWPEGQEHQTWLNQATPEQIAGWIIAAGRAVYWADREEHQPSHSSY